MLIAANSTAIQVAKKAELTSPRSTITAQQHAANKQLNCDKHQQKKAAFSKKVESDVVRNFREPLQVDPRLVVGREGIDILPDEVMGREQELGVAKKIPPDLDHASRVRPVAHPAWRKKSTATSIAGKLKKRQISDSTHVPRRHTSPHHCFGGMRFTIADRE
jgi:hypothetical protein